MTTQKQRAELFAALHVPGKPLILFNAWDAGSAKAVANSGAAAIATGSWSVAAANGYADGEALPLDLVLGNARRIAHAVNLPVTIDFEGGYGVDTYGVEASFAKLIATGAIGANMEDQIFGSDELQSIDVQRDRIRAARRAADAAGIPFFINARTDIFLKRAPQDHTGAALNEAVLRAKVYAEAGASGFFAPGLKDVKRIERLCAGSPLPVNIMAMEGATPPTEVLAQSGVARISYGPAPYRLMMAALTEAAKKVLLQ